MTWNYSEKSHGKGPPDGIGGAIKREADLYVNRGGALQTPKALYEMLTKRGSSITLYWVTSESIKKLGGCKRHHEDPPSCVITACKDHAQGGILLL